MSTYSFGRTEGRPLRVLTWHVHGNYLYYLSRIPHELYLPVTEDRAEGYGGRAAGLPWPDNVIEVPAERVREMDFDCILYQSQRNWLTDRYAILSEEQRRLPQVFLTHDPPREHPTDSRHPVDDPDALIVHVTHFNDLMWDCGRTPTTVIEHGVTVPKGVHYAGDLEKGVSVVNGIARRERRCGHDVFRKAAGRVPLDLVGMFSQEAGGLGEVPHERLPEFVARYRFFFNPIRYTSLGLAVCEAMMIGLPVIGLATTEMSAVIDDGVSGYVDTDIDVLVRHMQALLEDPMHARRLGSGAKRAARERFSIERFARDWDETLTEVAGRRLAYAGV